MADRTVPAHKLGPRSIPLTPPWFLCYPGQYYTGRCVDLKTANHALGGTKTGLTNLLKGFWYAYNEKMIVH